MYLDTRWVTNAAEPTPANAPLTYLLKRIGYFRGCTLPVDHL